MRISYSWLKERLELGLPPEELVRRLPSVGLEVASLERKGPAFSGVVTAEVLSVAKHPDADRLSLCQVTDGAQTYSVVCGAPNVAAGQKVPFARVGATLPGGKLSKAKIRGVESEGMICSAVELSLGTQASDIMVLDPATAVGVDAAELLGGGDVVLDIEVTPNRPDLLSHLGIARELSICFGLPLRKEVETTLQEDGELKPFPVEILSTGECPRYVGRLIEGVEVKDSPGWLKAKLEAVGLRPVNNVVDITNFILMDAGQPLHAFDADSIEGGRIIVRLAKPGESILALDGKRYPLSPEHLVIADASKPVAIAGVMGGQATSVTAKTKRLFLESAHFAPPGVRRASQALRLRSDSSFRFERGTDVSAAEWASHSAALLISRLCGKSVRVSPPLDVYPGRREPSPIRVAAARINAILGSDFPKADIEGVVERVCAKTSREGDCLVAVPPSWRCDLATPWDLAEEAARVLGYDRIPARVAPAALRPTEELRSHAVSRKSRSRMAALGFHECWSYDFLSVRQVSLLELPEAEQVALTNPLSEDWAVLRPSLAPGLLDAARRNNARAESVRLFEVGKVYRRAGAAVEERTRLAALLLGPMTPAHWRAPKETAGFFDAKAVMADLLSGVPGLRWTASGDGPGNGFAGDHLFLPSNRLFIQAPTGKLLATLGALHPRLARAWEMERQRPVLFEIDLDHLAGLSSPAPVFRAFSPFPSSWRDLSVVVRENVPYEEIEACIRSLRIGELDSVQLVDLYEGSGVPEGKRSLSLRLVFGRPDRTLTDAEVSSAVERILAELKNRFDAALRT
ncbi:MAG: phenylalanine--tRNA ligase subunit beta [Elusimicrobia bacterium]|nr:phenylalanine--tRNA ligase subunit beta [Elusimicrobiota bacterium]